MTNPARTLAAIIGVAEQLTANLGAHMGVELALAPDVLRAGALTGGSRSSDHPDPTGTIATTLTARADRDATSSWPDFCDDAEAALRILRRMQARQAACIRQDPATAREADANLRALRCDGTVDPLCTRNAVKGGLCHACIKRRQREAAAHEGGHVHRELLDSGTVEPSAPQAAFVVPATDATCGRCGATFTGSDIDDVQGQLARHHTFDCPAR